MKKHTKRIVAAIVFAVALVLLVPSGIGTQTGLLQTTQAAAKLNTKKKTMVVGQKVTLKVKGTKKKVKWSTSNKKIATVSKKGVVLAKKAGTATITAKVGKKKLRCKVTVKKNEMTLSASSPRLTGVYDMGQDGPMTSIEVWPTKIKYTARNKLVLEFHLNNTSTFSWTMIKRLRGVYVETQKGDVLLDLDPVTLTNGFELLRDESKTLTLTFKGDQVKKFVNLRKAGGIRYAIDIYLKDEWY